MKKFLQSLLVTMMTLSLVASCANMKKKGCHKCASKEVTKDATAPEQKSGKKSKRSKKSEATKAEVKEVVTSATKAEVKESKTEMKKK